MGFVVTLVCAAALQQLRVEPFPGEVGEPVTITASQQHAALAGIELLVELPDGSQRTLPPTDARGEVHFVPELAGQYVYSVSLAEVRVLMPHRVVAPRRRWWLALGTVPLSLALLWQISRARGRRGP